MKIFGIEILKEKRAENYSPSSDFWYSIASHSTTSGMTVSPETVLRIAVALACVRVISETIGTIPIKSFIKKKGSRVEETDSDVAYIFANGPNEILTIADYMERIVAELLLRGDHVSIIRGKRGVEITSLEPVAPDDFVKIELKRINGEQYLVYHLRNPETKAIEQYTGDQILHIRGLQANRCSLRGASVITLAADCFGSALAADQFASATFKNQGMPSGALEYPEGLEEGEIANIKKSWAEAYGGSENAGKVAILEHGMKFTKFGLSPADTQLLDARKFSGILICGVFRVPPHKVAIMDKATWGNIEHQNIEFATDCIRPWTVKIEQAIRQKLYGFLALDTKKYYPHFNTEALYRGDIKTRYDSYAVARNWGWMSANDVREKEDMNPIGEQGDMYLVPLNMVPAEKAGEQPAAAPADAPADPVVDPAAKSLVNGVDKHHRGAANV